MDSSTFHYITLCSLGWLLFDFLSHYQQNLPKKKWISVTFFSLSLHVLSVYIPPPHTSPCVNIIRWLIFIDWAPPHRLYSSAILLSVFYPSLLSIYIYNISSPAPSWKTEVVIERKNQSIRVCDGYNRTNSLHVIIVLKLKVKVYHSLPRCLLPFVRRRSSV